MSHPFQGFQTCSASFWAKTSSRDIKSIWQIIHDAREGEVVVCYRCLWLPGVSVPAPRAVWVLVPSSDSCGNWHLLPLLCLPARLSDSPQRARGMGGEHSSCLGLRQDCWASGCLLPAQSISQEKNYFPAWQVGKRQSYKFSSNRQGRGDGIYFSVQGWILHDMQHSKNPLPLSVLFYWLTAVYNIGEATEPLA